jgi:hypothetical protein
MMRRLALLVILGLAACGGPEPREGTTASTTPATPVVSTCDYTTHSGCPAVPTGCRVRGALPDPTCTPGALYGPSQRNPASTVCVHGFTKTIRPPVTYTGPLKLELMKAYGFANRSPMDFELDHLVALEDGGAPSDPRNLWPQAHEPTPGSHEKDDLENALHALVCKQELSITAAGDVLAHNWLAEYERLQPVERPARGVVE